MVCNNSLKYADFDVSFLISSLGHNMGVLKMDLNDMTDVADKILEICEISDDEKKLIQKQLSLYKNEISTKSDSIPDIQNSINEFINAIDLEPRTDTFILT